MHAPSYLTLPQVLQLFRYDQRLSRHETARLAGLCPHCYEGIEVGRGRLSQPALGALYLSLPLIGALMADLDVTLPAQMDADLLRLRTLVRAMETLDDGARTVEMARIALALQWREQSPASPAEAGEP